MERSAPDRSQTSLRWMVACSYRTRSVCPALLPGEGRVGIWQVHGAPKCTGGTFLFIRDTQEVFTQLWENLLFASTPFPEQP